MSWLLHLSAYCMVQIVNFYQNFITFCKNVTDVGFFIHKFSNPLKQNPKKRRENKFNWKKRIMRCSKDFHLMVFNFKNVFPCLCGESQKIYTKLERDPDGKWWWCFKKKRTRGWQMRKMKIENSSKILVAGEIIQMRIAE